MDSSLGPKAELHPGGTRGGTTITLTSREVRAEAKGPQRRHRLLSSAWLNPKAVKANSLEGHLKAEPRAEGRKED